MKEDFKFSYANGAVTVKAMSEEVVAISQNGNTIYLKPDEIDRLAKGLFAFQKKNFPAPIQQPTVLPSVQNTMTPGSQYMAEQKSLYGQAYQGWTPEEDGLLRQLFQQGKPLDDMAQQLKRSNGGIASRLKKLGLT